MANPVYGVAKFVAKSKMRGRRKQATTAIMEGKLLIRSQLMNL